MNATEPNADARTARTTGGPNATRLLPRFTAHTRIPTTGPEFAFRRATLLGLLVCVTVSALIGLLLTPMFAYRAGDVVGLLLIMIKSGGLFVWLWRRPHAFLAVGLIDLTFRVTAGLLKFSSLLLTDGLSRGLGAYSHWLPLMYLVAALVLPARLALAVSLTVLGGLLTIGIRAMQAGTITPENWALYGAALIQLYVMHAAVIAFLALLVRFQGVYARALGQAEHHARLANADALTGLPNRRQLTVWLDAALDAKEPLCAVLLDLDHFKRVNDTHGHEIGDDVLRHTANVVRGVLRDGDRFGRWGGEEFLLILPDCDASHAHDVAQRIQTSLANAAHPLAGAVTVSCGIAAARPNERSADLLRRADTALYDAKDAGRNVVRTVA